MCFATLAAGSLAALSANAGAIGAAGSLVSAGGAVFGGIAAGDAASYNAKVAANNAQIAKQNATYSLQAGNAKEQQAGLQSAEQVGAVRTSQAANNVDVNSGSALDVEAGTREKGDLNEETVANNAELQAYGYQGQATGFEAQENLDNAQAVEAPIGADIGAAGSFASSASAIGFKWGGTPAAPASSGSNGVWDR